MTVCVAIKVHDCIVFAADSATSLVSSNGGRASYISNVYFHGNKVFNLKKGLPIAAMTCGMGNIGPVSISTLAKDFRDLLTDGDKNWKIDDKKYTIEEVAEKARAFFFEEKYSKLEATSAGDHSFEFWIGGNDARETHGEIWKVLISNGKCAEPKKIAGKSDFNMFFGGQPEAINRLVLGYSQKLPDALKSVGIKGNQLRLLIDHIESFTYNPLSIPAMPIQDAIDLADFLVDLTTRFVRFQLGADTVGGETDICAVTKHEGFKWIRRKNWYPLTLNPKVGNH
jgi:hypothetical protein